MRTKTLLLSAAALAAGLVSSVAQSNVYSANVVGYINLALTNGFNLVSAGQLGSDVSGTNNTVDTVFGTNLPAPSTVFAWSTSAATFNNALWSNQKGVNKWSGDTTDINKALQAGQGVFVQTSVNTSVTVVGNVVQGTNITHLSTGYNLVSPVPPLGGGLQTALGYAPTVGDQVFLWNPSTQTYDANSPYLFVNAKGTLKWSPSEPQVQVGQAVFINTTNPGWTNTFTVQ